LLAHLYAIYICKQATAHDILQELQAIRQTRQASHTEDQLDQVYERTIETIRRAPKRTAERALRVLSWLCNARRALNIEELRVAVSIEEHQNDLDVENLPTTEKLADICAGLVNIKEGTYTVRLVHYTAKEYLERNSVVPEHLQGGYHARFCATYLAFDEFKKGACKSQETFEDRISHNAFLNNAAGNLSYHIKGNNEVSTAETVARLIKHSTSLSSYLQARKCHNVRGSLPYRWSDYPNGRHPIHTACELGHVSITWSLIDLDDTDLSAADSAGYTPLHLATNEGHEAVACILIDRKANKSAADPENGWTPLFLAAKNGQEAMMRILIDGKASVSAVDRYQWTPLHWAAKNGHGEVTRMLIDAGADVSTKDPTGWTPLLLAAKCGHEEVAQILIDRGAEVLAANSNESTPLHYAAINGHNAVARILIDGGAEVSAATSNASTPLHWAAKNGHEAVMRMLIDGGAKVSAADADEWTPLLFATKCGHEAVARILLDGRAGVTATNRDGKTPLKIATENKHDAVVRLLTDRGLSVNNQLPP